MSERSDPPRRSKAPPVLILLPFVVAMVLVPFLFWYGTWFGKALSDEEIDARLDRAAAQQTGDDTVVRRTQHALEQITRRMQNDSRAERFYPKVLALVSVQSPALRRTVAWVLGQDPHEARFADALRGLTADADPLVRMNAALQLVRHRDRSGLPILRSMLEPYVVCAPVAGTLSARLDPGRPVREGIRIAMLDSGETELRVVRAPLPGRVERAARVGSVLEEGDEICRLDPGAEQVESALRALGVIGRAADIALIHRAAARALGSGVRAEARRAAARIEARIEKLDAESRAHETAGSGSRR